MSAVDEEMRRLIEEVHANTEVIQKHVEMVSRLFTRKDLWQLDQAIMDAEALPRPAVQIAALRTLYDRIEALLPPEGS